MRCSIGGRYWDQQVAPVEVVEVGPAAGSSRKTRVSKAHRQRRSKDSSDSHKPVGQGHKLSASGSRETIKPRHREKGRRSRSTVTLATYIDTSKLLLETEGSFADAFAMEVDVFREEKSSCHVTRLATGRVYIAPLVDKAVQQAASNQAPLADMKGVTLRFESRDDQDSLQCRATVTFCFVRLAPTVTAAMEGVGGCIGGQQSGRQQGTVELAMKRLFYAIDTDGSGCISFAELAAAVQHRRLPRSHSSALRLQTTDFDLLMGQLLMSHADEADDATEHNAAANVSANVIQELFDKIVSYIVCVRSHNHRHHRHNRRRRLHTMTWLGVVGQG